MPAFLSFLQSQPCGPPEEAAALCDWVYDATGNELLARASDVLVLRPVRIVMILLVAFVLNRLAKRAIARFVRSLQTDRMRRGLETIREKPAAGALFTTDEPSQRASLRASTTGAVLSSVTGFVIWTIAFIYVLAELRINLAPLIAGAGIAGIAIGFGAQNLVRDFLSGLFMLIEDQYGVGDVIDVGGVSGVVEGVSLRTTRLRDVHGNVWHVPNGTIERVGNRSQLWARSLLDVSVAYDTDLDHAMEVIGRVAREMADDPAWREAILEEPEVWGVENLGESGIDIRLVVKTKPRSQWEVSRELRRRLKQSFDAEGIQIPFPQRTVWTRTDEGAERDVRGPG
ncbi:MAG TPA: mechanosensitive ion channel family protein [Actinomycetota bacterium]|jgi:moderate conductance mechanosensitive channel|nr:mechanosensitive ion channel family protein [Actinomycetota bacterium]